MRIFLLLLGVLALSANAALATGMPSPMPAQGAPSESVEEPDSPDDDTMSEPEEQAPVEPPKEAATIKPDIKPPPEIGPAGDSHFSQVVLQGLNKVTARAQTIEAPIGSVVRFGTIEIIAHSCWKSAPDERPENAALLEISEIKQGEAPTQIFLGWMFSSSPGLSALEHPFYDVSVVKCDQAEAEALPAAAAPSTTPPAKAAAKKLVK